MSTHAKLSASSAHRWMRCAGSVRLSAGIPNEGSRNAAEGTFAHEIAAAALTGIQPARSWLGKRRIVDDKYEIECTQEMVDHVNSYVESVGDELMATDQWWVEVDLTPALAKLHPKLGGTADFVRYRPEKKHLRVRDFKYGAGVLVDVEENEQALMYALGALLTQAVPCESVTVTIDQPRAEHPDGRSRDYTFPSYRLLEFADELVTAAKATEAPDAPLVAGEKQCKWCLAKSKCPELEKRQNALMVQDFAVPGSVASDRLAEALTFFPAVKARIKALEEEAYARATRGETIPGFKLVEKRPTRQWRDPVAVVAWAKDRAINPYGEPELLSPAQMEKRAAEGLPRGAKGGVKEAIEPLVEKVSSGSALVPAEDSRPEAKRLDEQKDYAIIGGAAQPEQQAVINLF